MAEKESLIPFRCPHCGREIETYERDGSRVFYGHRTEATHTPETPWCAGGGTVVPSLAPPSPTDGPDFHADLALWKERVLAP